MKLPRLWVKKLELIKIMRKTTVSTELLMEQFVLVRISTSWDIRYGEEMQ